MTEWRIRSHNGVTSGPYKSRAAAVCAAARTNKYVADHGHPQQDWHAWLYED